MPIISNQLKDPKSPNDFAAKHTGGSIAKQPKTVSAAMNKQLATEMPKLSEALVKLLKAI